MAQTKYTYSIANDTLNAKADLAALEVEVRGSAIITAHDYTQALGDVLDIYMKDAVSAGDKTILDGIISTHTGDSIAEEHTLVDVHQTPAFADKKVTVNGLEKSLFKRVHGVSITIAAGVTGYLDFVIPYNTVKFTGAEIFGVQKGDQLDFLVLDTPTNTVSGLDVPTYGANFLLNQFGFNVKMPAVGEYKNTSQYDADLIKDMVIECAYKNNGNAAITIDMNVEIHEVK